MAATVVDFAASLRERFAGAEVGIAEPRGEVGIVFDAAVWHDGCRALRDEFGFEMLIDVCGVDTMGYGSDEWDTGVSSQRSEEHTSELQSLMRNSYDGFCLTKTKTHKR